MMSELCLDYQRATFGGGWLRAALLAAGIAAAAAVLFYQWGISQEIVRREVELSKIERQLKPGAASAIRVSGTPKQLEDDIRRAKGVIEQLLLPWERMFAAIETSDEKGIALLLVQPNAEKRRITIGGEAKSLIVVLDYIRRLERSGALAKVHLTSHEVQQQDPQKPVRFVIEASWAAS